MCCAHNLRKQIGNETTRGGKKHLAKFTELAKATSYIIILKSFISTFYRVKDDDYEEDEYYEDDYEYEETDDEDLKKLSPLGIDPPVSV